MALLSWFFCVGWWICGVARGRKQWEEKRVAEEGATRGDVLFCAMFEFVFKLYQLDWSVVYCVDFKEGSAECYLTLSCVNC